MTIGEVDVSPTILLNSPPYLDGMYSDSSQHSKTEAIILLGNLVWKSFFPRAIMLSCLNLNFSTRNRRLAIAYLITDKSS